MTSLRAWLTQLILPPVVLVLPWCVPAYRRQWGLAAFVFLSWAAGIGIMLLKWAGVGALMLLAVGSVSLLATRVNV